MQSPIDAVSKVDGGVKIANKAMALLFEAYKASRMANVPIIDDSIFADAYSKCHDQITQYIKSNYPNEWEECVDEMQRYQIQSRKDASQEAQRLFPYLTNGKLTI